MASHIQVLFVGCEHDLDMTEGVLDVSIGERA